MIKRWLSISKSSKNKEQQQNNSSIHKSQLNATTDEIPRVIPDLPGDISKITSISVIGNPSTKSDNNPSSSLISISSDSKGGGAPESSVEKIYKTDIVKSRPTEALPFGDGSNKVFGYENFGNTCYCNSILQSLFALDDFRNNVLKYPTIPEGRERHRKLSMAGNAPRHFKEESFDPAYNERNSSAKNASGSSNNNSNSNTSSDNNINGSSGLNGKGSGPLNSQNQVRSRMNDSLSKISSSKDINNTCSTNNKEIELIHTVIMPADIMTEKLHEGCKRIIVGRCDEGDNPIKNSKPNISQNNYTTTELYIYGENKVSNNLGNMRKDSLDGSFYNSEQRKKAALIKGPVLNIDHMVNVTAKSTLYNGLKDIFECITENQHLTGIVSPTQFIKILKKENVLFNTMMQQDAHEFLNFLLNSLNEYLQLYSGDLPKNGRNFVLDQFQGILTNRVKCLTCDTITVSDEPFLDFPVEVMDDEERNIQDFLQSYHQRELLQGTNKFYCNQCCGLQEAERIVGLKSLPTILALHLKRFKYSEEKETNIKLFNKIRYPLRLEVSSTFNTKISKKYELCSIVVHMGNGPQHGHYVSVCKTKLYGWLLYDDETVESIDEETVLRFIGDQDDQETAYVLFYKDMGDCKENSDETTTGNETNYDENVQQLIKADAKIKQNAIKRQERQDLINEATVLEARKEKAVKNQSNGNKHSKQNKRRSRILSFIKS